VPINVVTKYTTIGSRSSGSGSGGGHVNEDAHRASGGPVTKGMPYIVGEHRPELFVPKENGTILPKVPGRAKASSLAPSGGGTTININVNGALDPNSVAKQIQQMLLRLKRNNGGELGIA
jgi:hypothetical protein